MNVSGFHCRTQALIPVLVAIMTFSMLACGPSSPAGEPLSADYTEDEIRTTIENYAEGKTFDAAVRVAVRSVVEIDVPVDDIDWSPYRKPEFTKVWRHTVDVIEIYDGTVPDHMVLITNNRQPAATLDATEPRPIPLPINNGAGLA